MVSTGISETASWRQWYDKQALQTDRSSKNHQTLYIYIQRVYTLTANAYHWPPLKQTAKSHHSRYFATTPQSGPSRRTAAMKHSRGSSHLLWNRGFLIIGSEWMPCKIGPSPWTHSVSCKPVNAATTSSTGVGTRSSIIIIRGWHYDGCVVTARISGIGVLVDHLAIICLVLYCTVASSTFVKFNIRLLALLLFVACLRYLIARMEPRYTSISSTVSSKIWVSRLGHSCHAVGNNNCTIL
jgi:hypothetical protein